MTAWIIAFFGWTVAGATTGVLLSLWNCSGKYAELLRQAEIENDRLRDRIDELLDANLDDVRVLPVLDGRRGSPMARVK